MLLSKAKPFWPYAGIPVIGATLLIVRLGQTDPFTLLRSELIMVFGFIAAVTDLKTKRIPNGLIKVMLASWALIMMPKLIIHSGEGAALLKDSAFGFLIGGGLFLLVYLMSRKGLGGGDVKFMAAAGLFLGFGGTIQAMLVGTVLAAITGLVLILLKKIGRKDPIPLAPFLCIGIVLTIFFI